MSMCKTVRKANWIRTFAQCDNLESIDLQGLHNSTRVAQDASNIANGQTSLRYINTVQYDLLGAFYRFVPQYISSKWDMGKDSWCYDMDHEESPWHYW